MAQIIINASTKHGSTMEVSGGDDCVHLKLHTNLAPVCSDGDPTFYASETVMIAGTFADLRLLAERMLAVLNPVYPRDEDEAIFDRACDAAPAPEVIE